MSGKCEVYKDINEQHKDLSSDESLLAFFQEILKRQEELEETD